MKTDKEHRIPLSNEAIEVLEHANKLVNFEKSQSRKGWIFLGRKRTQPLSNMAMLALLKRMKRNDIVPHGFRSTFRDWASEQTAYPGDVAEAALAHHVQNKVEAAYRRGDLFEKRRKLMKAWAEYCGKPSVKPQEDNVFYLQKRKRTARR